MAVGESRASSSISVCDLSLPLEMSSWNTSNPKARKLSDAHLKMHSVTVEHLNGGIPPNSVCHVRLAACAPQDACAHCNRLLRHPWDGAQLPQEVFFILFYLFYFIFFSTLTALRAPSLTGISLGEQSAVACVCSPPDRPHHRLHANCGGVAGLRRPCVVKEEGGREFLSFFFFTVWWAGGSPLILTLGSRVRQVWPLTGVRSESESLF